MHTDLPFVVAAPAHPSLDGAIVRFCDDLGAETRRFGGRGADAPAPSLALVRRLGAAAPGMRLAAVHDGAIVGLARIDVEAPAGPELLVAVAAPWRRRGVARALGHAIVARAHDAGIERVVLHTSYRSAELGDLGAALGCRVVDLGCGRVDLIRTRQPEFRSA
ncbi:MAG TPA: GNAT family N-acetyltransferase [Ilumatobacteraceae bacterium]|nr:GNAT family N-acetyltransferase [Ilumatobacteraceae bacterium]